MIGNRLRTRLSLHANPHLHLGYQDVLLPQLVLQANYNAQEEFYLGNKQYLRSICPYIYKKVILLDEIEEEEKNYEF